MKVIKDPDDHGKIPDFCPFCGNKLENEEKYAGFCDKCEAEWDIEDYYDDVYHEI